MSNGNKYGFFSTFYSSPYVVLHEEDYTKHYFIEGERVATKIGGGFADAPIFPWDSTITFIIGNADSLSKHLEAFIIRQAQCSGDASDAFVISEGFASVKANDNEEPLYFYNPDHLGSASFITDETGTAIQHLQYFPFGELFVSQMAGSFDSRYKFSAKELDNETNYSYFGARYYTSEESIWLSVDPMSDKYPSMSPYMYCAGNPVVLVDPNGQSTDWFQNELTGAVFYNSEMRKGDETSLGKNWSHLGANNMFANGNVLKTDYNILLNNKSLTSIKTDNGKFAFSGYMKGDKAKTFMKSQGYDFNPIQAIIYTMKPTFGIQYAQRQPEISIQINEKYRYMSENSVLTGRGNILPLKDRHLASYYEYVGRYAFNYSDDLFSRGFNFFNNLQNPQSPIEYKSWPEFDKTNLNFDILNKYRKDYGEE